MIGNPHNWPEQMAIIEHPRYGMDDHNAVGLFFGVRFLGGGAGLYIPTLELTPILLEHRIEDVARLHGKPCVVAVEPGGGMALVRFVRFFD